MKLKLLSLIVVLAIAFGVKAQWSILPNTSSNATLPGYIICMNVDKSGKLYCAGIIRGKSIHNYVAKWDGITWTELNNSNTTYPVTEIQNISSDNNGNLYITNFDRNNLHNFFIYKWDGINWKEAGISNSSPLNDTIFTITTDKGGAVYAAGCFKNSIGGNYVTKWDGLTWTELGGKDSSIFNNKIRKIVIDSKNNVYIGGDFTNANGKKFIAKWDGIKWSELGGINQSDFNNSIMTMTLDRFDNIYVGGRFTNTNGNYYISKWEGISWSELRGNTTWRFDSSISSINSDLVGNIYVGGHFFNLNGHKYVAKWDGTSWSELGGNNSLKNITSPNYFNNINTVITDNSGSVYVGGDLVNKLSKWSLAKYTKEYPILYIDKIDTTTCSVSLNVPVRGKNLYNISTLKGSIHWDTAYLNLGGIKFDSTYLKMNFNQIDVTHAANGYLTYNWSDTIGHSVADSAPLFTMVMYPKPNVSGGTGIWFDSIPNKLEIDTAINVAAKNATFNNGWVILSDTPQIIQSVNLLTCSAGCLPMHYQWYINGNPIQFDTLNYIYPTTNGVYTCVVTYRTGVSISSTPVNVVLPVTLTYFKVQGGKLYNTLSWQTATEINTSHFNIQRSTNGKDFTTIEKVNAKGASTYTFNDPLTTDDSRFTKLYYRLQIVDKDGVLSYSEVRELSIVNSSLSISPNPAKDFVTISGTNLKQVKLLDNLGRVVAVKESANSNSVSIPVSHKAKGIYMVQATFKDGSIKTEKIVVE